MAQLFQRLASRVREWDRRRRFAASVRHLHGPENLSGGPQDVIVIALIRNGAYYLDEFLAYYRGLGVRHFAFFDNGSTDDGIARLMREPGCVVDSSPLPLARYEDLIRQYAAYRYGRNRWVLYADMDELFTYPNAKELPLPKLVQDLSRQGYTAMMAQMLEMFPDAPLRDVAGWTYDQVISGFDHYDVSDVRWVAYRDRAEIPFWYLLKDNDLPEPAPRFAFGGVRGRVFGEGCCLTKHPLVFVGDGTVPAPHPHCASRARVADVQGLIRHYKFANDAFGRDRVSAMDGSLDHGEDKSRLSVLEQRPDLSLMGPGAQKWAGVKALYSKGFVTVPVAWSARNGDSS